MHYQKILPPHSPSTPPSTALIPYHNTLTNKLQRYAYQNPKITKASLFVVTKTSSVALTALLGLATTFYLFLGVTVVIIASAIHIGKNNGHSTSTVLKHLKFIASSPFSLMIPSKFAMSNHFFERKQKSRSTHFYHRKQTYNSNKYGGCKLTYEGDIPVLTLVGSPKTCGSAHGRLAARQIHELIKTWDSVLWTIIPDATKAVELCEHLKKIIPKEYIEEMEGLVNGYNQKIYNKGLGEPLTLDKLLLLHLVPDSEHTFPSTLVKSGFACTVILDRGDETTGPIFGRHMDYPTLGVVGKTTLVIRRIFPSGKIIHEIVNAGLIGSVTWLSNRGLAGAMNVALGKTQDYATGLPAIILNSMVARRCDTVKMALKLIKALSPLGPYHLSLADKTGQACSVHFYQASLPKYSHFIRHVEPGKYLVTTNCCYNEEGSYNHYFNSAEREKNIDIAYNRFSSNPPPERKTVVAAALKAPLVNNIETALSAIMYPKLGIIEMAFANAFAADRPRQIVRFHDFLGSDTVT